MVLKYRKYEPPRSINNVSGAERAISAAVYLPCLVGFVLGIIYIAGKGQGYERNFFRFHFYQSVFLSICLFAIKMVADGMSGVLIGTLRLFEGVLGSGAINFMTENTVLVVCILMAPCALLTPYGMIWALLGKYANIPFVSDMIRKNLR